MTRKQYLQYLIGKQQMVIDKLSADINRRYQKQETFEKEIEIINLRKNERTERRSRKNQVPDVRQN